MNPITPAPEDIQRYLDTYHPGHPGHYITRYIGGPEEGDGIIPCPTVIQGSSNLVFHVAWKLDEIELVHLAKGGTLWLTTFGQLPVHAMTVLPKENDQDTR